MTDQTTDPTTHKSPLPSGRRPRLEDVAKRAGVSLGSASRALSMPDKVKQSTLSKVKAAADELGYVPHGAARALASQRSRLIGAVLPTINNPIYSDFAQALQKVLRAQHHQLLIAAHEYNLEDEHAIVEQLLQTGVDGLVLVGNDHPPELYQLIDKFQRPYVCAWSVDRPDGHHCVGIDNTAAMTDITRHLLSQGHRQFGVIAGASERNERTLFRLKAIQDTLSEAGIELSTSHIIETGFDLDSGRSALTALLQQSPRPSAVICTTDLLAAGALAAARAQQLSVPHDIAITGFDDIELAALLDPPLTTVHVDTDAIGRLTGERLLQLLDNSEAVSPDPSTPILIPTTLRIRQSSGAPFTARGNS